MSTSADTMQCHLGVTMPYPGGGDDNIPWPLPLPGIVIFVHGVNSDGEWHDAAEAGLCKGLNTRLRREDQHLAYPGPRGGQLNPPAYRRELTDEGYLNPDYGPKTFIDDQHSYSPVLRFRWGYKAAGRELQQYGSGIYLNEEDYWGGGPFANGCTSLPDLWSEGLSAELFMWLQVQHLNPLAERQVYTCPPRAYMVLAAYRLARLVKAIREVQVDCPITIVCHSQGNMVGMAAAFLGERMAPVTNNGKSAPCVADNYVLCNPPYSVIESNMTEDWSQGRIKDAAGRSGRQTVQARLDTLKNFFAIVRKRQELAATQTSLRIDKEMANASHGYTAASDAAKYALPGHDWTYGRVTLYCCPHDQVIGSLAVQGMGWRGLSADEIAKTQGEGVFTQRVYAQGYEVGQYGKNYHYWHDHYRKPAPGSADFWYPRAKAAQYSIDRGLAAADSWAAKILTVVTAPLLIFATKALPLSVNGLPPKDWEIPIRAPALPTFLPQAMRYGSSTSQFDQDYDAPGESRNASVVRGAGDAYAGDYVIPMGGMDGAQQRTTAGKGTATDEAALRYEHHAQLRMQAKREKLYRSDEKVVQEDEPDKASPEYTAWRNKKIKQHLADTADAYATDHSSILTNPMHAEKALAYDVAIGVAYISPAQLLQLRILADWRLAAKESDLSKEPIHAYHTKGTFLEVELHEWANQANSEVRMPAKISSIRGNNSKQSLTGARS